ncbi:zinc-binding dehydrogenase [Thioclava sp. GXIMD4215]|uniref:zinc-binding dehydrogenase n=1 Tax=Thioclava sp. GXIMD4215 TaxID=3131928 RepID=UPI003254DFB1
MSDTTMQAILLDRPGPLETLRFGTLPIPHPAPGEVLVRVQAAGLNPVDYKFAEAGDGIAVWPHVLGVDVAGTVEAVGEAVSKWRPGQRVAFFGDPWRRGGFAQLAIARVETLAAIPDGMSFESAAALPTAGLTAYQILHRKLPERPQIVLIFGVSGGVGGLAVQIAKAAGHHVIAVARADRADMARALGAHTVLAPGPDLLAQLKASTNGHRADFVIDTIGPDNPNDVLDLIAFNGGLASIVAFPDFSRLRWFERGISLHEIALGAAYRYGDKTDLADLGSMLASLFAMVDRGEVAVTISDMISFADIPRSLDRLKRRQLNPGKVVATMDFPSSNQNHVSAVEPSK